MTLDQLQYPGHFSLVLSLICLIIELIIFIKLIVQTRAKLPSLSVIVAYLSIFFFIFHNIQVLIESIQVVYAPNSFTYGACIARFMSPWLYTTGEILMYLFYVNRLHKIFTDTTFKYSKKKLIIFAICIVIGFYISISILTYLIIKNAQSAKIKGIFDGITTVHDCELIFDLYNGTNFKLFLSSIIISLIVESVTSIVILRYGTIDCILKFAIFRFPAFLISKNASLCFLFMCAFCAFKQVVFGEIVTIIFGV